MIRSLPLLLVVALLSCSEPPGTVKVNLNVKTTPGTPVVTYGDQSLSVEELNKKFGEMNPYARMRFQTMDAKKDYVDQAVRFELMAREAAKRGMQNNPAVVEALKQVMVRELLRKELDETKPTVPAEAVADYYEKHHGDYVKPSMVRLSHVFLAKDHKAKADELLKAALALAPHDYAGFAKLARENSENPQTKSLDGDMRFLSEDELSKTYGPEVFAAQAELTQVGQVLPKLVETKEGFHVLKLQGRQVALNLTLEQVKPSIEATLQNEMRQSRYKDFVDKLKKDANVKVDEAALATVVVDTKDAKAPAPGGPAQNQRPTQ
ncbi:MAG: peptidyl-prolyl cis-trans isomerase [Myxococcaceae bacterium]